jgi:hypothetical protein
MIPDGGFCSESTVADSSPQSRTNRTAALVNDSGDRSTHQCMGFMSGSQEQDRCPSHSVTALLAQTSAQLTKT